jgi:hypothetical protein
MNSTAQRTGSKILAAGILLAFFQINDGLPENAPSTWYTQRFEAFRRGEFYENNLYVSRKGRLQTIHRFDVNNDGYYDLIFNNTHDMSYEVPAYLYRFTHGRTEPVRTGFAGVGSVSVRVADLNGDGLPDVVVARGFDDTTHELNSWIYWGNPDGWSSRRHTELPTPYVRDVCVADLNHDGHPALVFIGGSAGSEEPEAQSSNTSFIYWAGSSGYSYHNRTSLETPNANGCLVADFDGDGFMDLLVTATGRSMILWGGPGGISAESLTSAVDSANGAALLGQRLVLVTPKAVEIGSFADRSLVVERRIPFEGGGKLAIADLNRDGTDDLVVTRAMTSDLYQRIPFGANGQTSSRIFWGKKQRQNEVFTESDHTDLETLGAVDVAISDIDVDGYPDIVFANSRSRLSYDVPSYIYWGGPEGYSTARRSELPTHGAQSVAVMGKDVFFANSQTGRPIGDIDTYVYFGNADGDYSTRRMQRLPTIGGYESCVADLNDDGNTDLLLVSSHEGDPGGPTGSFLYWGDRDGLSPSRRSELPTRGPIGCAVADVNRDGYLDLLFTNMDDDTASIFYGGPAGFRQNRQFSLKVRSPRFPAIADLNKDGYLDLLIPSIDDGLYIYWGSVEGYNQSNYTLLPAVGPVSTQIADLNGDGYLDIVVCDFVDLKRWIFHGVNSLIYWGSPNGYSGTNSTTLPSLGAHHATIADFNRDGFLDIFLSNYQSEFTRDLDSHIYWGNPESSYSATNRQALHVGSAAGVVSADFNGDGWIDLAVSNHVQNGHHQAKSLIFWNSPKGFDERRRTELPTVGPHMMTGVDQGNIYTRQLQETFTSEIHDAGQPCAPQWLQWEGTTPFGSKLRFELRGAGSVSQLKSTAWIALGFHSNPHTRIQASKLAPQRLWQYRVTLADGRVSSPALERVTIKFGEP